MKKLLSLVLVLSLVLGSVGFAFAATPADVVDTDYEDAVSKLMGLEVLTGYPDGSFGPEKTITRAEFAAVAVRVLGLDSAAEYAKGATMFSDVAADFWGAGYVNIAADQGVINGYPDGTFLAGNPVTYAEAVTILVRALGYGPLVDEKGTWPSNYIAKATELGITDDVAFVGMAAAKRGDIAIMADNSLTVEMMVRTGFGDDATYEIDEDMTLLDDKIKAESKTDFLVATKLVDSDLDADEIKLADEGVVEFVNDVDYDNLLGEQLKFWFDNDGDVFFVEDDNDEVVMSKYVDFAVNDIEVVDPDDEDEILTYEFTTMAADLVFFFDATGLVEKTATELKDADPSDADIKLILDSEDVVQYAVVYDWELDVVDDVDLGDEEIKVAGSDIELEGQVYDLDLADLDEDNFVYWVKADTNTDDADDNAIDRYWFAVADEEVSGELSKVTSGEITVDGDAVDYGSYTTGTYQTKAQLVAILGEDVTVSLDKWGNVYEVALDSDAATADDYAIVTDLGFEENAYGDETAYIKLLTADDEVIEYVLDDEASIRVDGSEVVDMDATGADIFLAIDGTTMKFDTADADVATPDAVIYENDKVTTSTMFSVVKFELNSDGEIDILDVMVTDLVKVTDATVDEDSSLIGAYSVGDTTLLMERSDEEVVTFDDLKDGKDYTVYVVADEDSSFGDVEFILVSEETTSLAEATEYALVDSYSDVVDGYEITLFMNGAEQTFFADDDDVTTTSALVEGNLVEVEFSSGDISSLEAANYTTEDAFVVDVDYDDEKLALSTDGDDTDVELVKFADADVEVYNISDIADDDVTVNEFGDIDDEDTINYIVDPDDTNYVIFVVIQ